MEYLLLLLLASPITNTPFSVATDMEFVPNRQFKSLEECEEAAAMAIANDPLISHVCMPLKKDTQDDVVNASHPLGYVRF